MMPQADFIMKTDGRTVSMQTHHLSSSGPSLLTRTVFALARLPRLFVARTALARSRRSLAKLDPRLVRDIGLSCEEADAEARRPVWDAPLHWKS
jgi:uncharacterized protein YjiS (DUF1127 family)